MRLHGTLPCQMPKIETVSGANRPFPSCCEPHYNSEAKCKAFHGKISFVCI